MPCPPLSASLHCTPTSPPLRSLATINFAPVLHQHACGLPLLMRGFGMRKLVIGRRAFLALLFLTFIPPILFYANWPSVLPSSTSNDFFVEEDRSLILGNVNSKLHAASQVQELTIDVNEPLGVVYIDNTSRSDQILTDSVNELTALTNQGSSLKKFRNHKSRIPLITAPVLQQGTMQVTSKKEESHLGENKETDAVFQCRGDIGQVTTKEEENKKKVVVLKSPVIAGISDTLFKVNSGASTVQRGFNGYRRLKGCQDCNNKKANRFWREILDEDANQDQSDQGIDITVAYTDVSGDVRRHTISSRDLSSSWVWENPGDGKHSPEKAAASQNVLPQQIMNKSRDDIGPFVDQKQQTICVSPIKLKRQKLRGTRREKRIVELNNMSQETELQIRAAAIKRSMEFSATERGRYSIWKKEYQNPNSDSNLKLMKDQIIMAKAYASISHTLQKIDLYDSLFKHIRESQHVIEDASMDGDHQQDALEYAKAMGRALSIAKDLLYDCDVVDRKLRAMIQSTERSINAVKKQSTFLIQHAAKTVPGLLHCLPLQLTTDYYLRKYNSNEIADQRKLNDTSLYHYAIFSDNVLATSVVVNSTASHAKEPGKHVFHVVTDRLNFAAMRMWFIAHPPFPATVEVQNIDEFKWLNSSYCAVLRQLESERIKEYYFKADHPSSLSAENENLKYRNPKYLSLLNHLRFYMPRVYPKLDKILFLDDDIVVQKDLTPLWYIDMKGMVNGAVETCKESFHRFDTYLNFSNPKISNNFDPQACGWAFGMNILDLKEWKRLDLTGIYHHWQDLNEDRKLWKLGSLPPGLITFYNLTYPLDRSWHVLGLGYDPAINPSEIENAAVIHYNGNYKPWLDLAITKYKSYWSKFVNFDDPYLQLCSLIQ